MQTDFLLIVCSKIYERVLRKPIPFLLQTIWFPQETLNNIRNTRANKKRVRFSNKNEVINFFLGLKKAYDTIDLELMFKTWYT